MPISSPKTIRLEGLLSSVAQTEQLEQFAGEAKQRVAAPSSSAIEFADKLAADQDRLLRRTANSVGFQGGRIGASTDRVGVFDKGNPGFGMLTDAERAAETVQRAEQGAADEQRVRDKIAMRERLRQTPAAELGAPEDPRGVDPLLAEDLRKFDASRMETVAERAAERQAALTDPSLQVTQEWWMNAAQVGARSAIETGLSAAKYPAVLAEALTGFSGKSHTRAQLDQLSAYAEEMLPGDKARAKDFVTELAAGGGSMAAFMVASALMGRGGGVLVGAMAMGTMIFEDAEAHDATTAHKYLALLVGTGLGATEAIPIDRMFMRLNAATGGAVTRTLKRTTAGSLEEFIQELGQAVGEDVLAKYSYDPEREMDALSWLRQGAVGGIVGGGMAMTMSVGSDTAKALRDGYTQISPETEAATREALEMSQIAFDLRFGRDTDPNTAVEPPAPPPGAPAVAPQAAPVERLAEQLPAVREQLATLGVELDEEQIAQLTVADIEKGLAQLDIAAEQLAQGLDETQQAELQALLTEGITQVGLATEAMMAPEGMTVNERGKVELTHWAQEPRDVLDPAQMGTGPLRGVERERLAGGADVVPRVYYGVDAITDAVRDRKVMRKDTDGYLKEGGLGDVRHVVEVDPAELYDWWADPDGLRDQIDRSKPDTEQVTRYEKLIADAGYSGIYFSRSTAHGKTAMLFRPAEPTITVRDDTGEILRGEVADPSGDGGTTGFRDFLGEQLAIARQKPKKLPPARPAAFAKIADRVADGTAGDLFRSPGWGIITAIQESKGDHDSAFNRRALAQMEKELEGSGAIPVRGAYKGVDQGLSWVVFGSEAKLLDMARRYGQESILTSKGLVFSDGRIMAPAVHENTLVGPDAELEDFYSTFPDGTAFSMGLDFSGDADPELDADFAPAAASLDRIAARFPAQKQSMEDPLREQLVVNTDAMRAAPKAFEHNMGVVRGYPNWRKADKVRAADKVAELFTEHVATNLKWLYDQVPEEVRAETRDWYRGANAIANRWAERYELPPRAVAGVIAAMSPQKDWYANLSLAERLLDIVAYRGDVAFDPAMESVADQYFPTGPLRELVQRINGRSLEELVADGEGPALQALWVRIYDHAHHSPGVNMATARGDFIPHTGAAVAWGSLSEIGKALRIVADPSPENISYLMGRRHKIRSFYNNIIDPDGADDVTVDTHAVAAALLRPLSGNSPEVVHNFGNSLAVAQQPPGWVPTKNAGISGATGTYGLYADAYRKAAAELGILPRELQSVVWEAVRSMYPAQWKRNPDNAGKIEAVWERYRNGAIDLAQAHKEITDVTGGVPKPEWYQRTQGLAGRALAGRGIAADGRDGLSSYPRDISPAELPVWSARRVDGGARGGAATEAEADLDAQIAPTTEPFRQWFGDSKVVDENGEPLVVYHGSPAGGIKVFDAGRFGTRDGGFYGQGVYFSTDVVTAEEYAYDSQAAAEGTVYPAYVRIENPFVFNLTKDGLADTVARLKELGIAPRYSGDYYTFNLVADEGRRFTAAAKQAGFDGALVYRGESWASAEDQTVSLDEVVAFEPGQIKSAVSNSGDYDPTNPDIDAQIAPTTEPFRQWFGDSKVIDEQGEPLVVYHATMEPKDFSAFFALSHFGTAKAANQRIDAEGKNYVGYWNKNSRSFPVYLSIQNPLDVGREWANGGSWINDADMLRQIADQLFYLAHPDVVEMELTDTQREEFNQAGHLLREQASDLDGYSYGAFAFDEQRLKAAQTLEAVGFDGIKYSNEIEDAGSVSWVALRPEQIKSAVSNSGAYDPTNPNIDAQTSRGRGAYRGEAARPAKGVPDTGADIDPSEVGLRRIGDNFKKLLDLTVRQGRLTLRGATGQYSRRTTVTRLVSADDLSTLVHEGGHALNDQRAPVLDRFIADNMSDIARVAHDIYGGDLTKAPKGKVAREGFAEFFRLYVLNRRFAQNKFPRLTANFDQVLAQQAPDLRDGIEMIRDQYDLYLSMPSTRVLQSMVSKTGPQGGLRGMLREMADAGVKTWFNELGRRAVRDGVNKFEPLNKLVAETLNVSEDATGRALDVKAADDPRVLARLARNSGGRATVELVDGVVPYKAVHPASRGLREAFLLSQGLQASDQLGEIDEQRRLDFDAYLVALRGIAEYERLAAGELRRAPLNATLGDLRQAVADFEATYGAAFQEAATIVDEYGRALWKKQYDAGLIDPETYKTGLDKAFYAPLQRDMSDRQSALGQSVLTAAKQGRSIVKRFRGSDRQVLSPMQVLMHKTYAVEAAIAENDVKKALASLADKTAGAGALVERIPAHQIIGQSYSVLEVARKLTGNPDMDVADAADLMAIVQSTYEKGDVLSLFRSEQASTAGENIMFFWEKGKLQAIQLADGEAGADVVATLTAVGRESMPMFTEALAMTSTAFRAAITSWPDFLLVNFIRDQMSAWILTDVGYVPFVSGAKGMYEEVQQKGFARDYNVAMGVMGGMNTAALHDARVDRDLNALRKRGYVAQMFGKPGMLGAVQGLAKITELSETGTRVGIYAAAFNRAKADGLTDYEASVEASYIATDYIDFGLHGNRTLLARRLVPFLGAQVNGLYKMMRTLGGDEVRQRKGLAFVLRAYFKNVNGLELSRREKQAINTGRKAWLKMVSISLIGAALTALYWDDEDYQDTSEYLRATGWVAPLGDGRIAYVPKPFELALVNNIVERGIEAAYGDRAAGGRLLRGAALTLTPPTTPPLLGAFVEHRANYSFFRQREIVPDYMQALAPELQYNNYTSELAKWLGEKTGSSPMVIDHYLNSLGASAYRDVTAMINAADPGHRSLDVTDMPITRRFVRDARRGATSAADFWDMASTRDGSLQGAYRSYREFIETGRGAAAERFLQEQDELHQTFAILNTHFTASAKRLHPMYRARQASQLISGMRRELNSDLGLERTEEFNEGAFLLSREQKRQLDIALSELSRREVRNALVFTSATGWDDKEPLDVQTTVDMIAAIHPGVADELRRRAVKARLYPADFVYDAWPDIQNRLMADREGAILTDYEAMAKALYKLGAYQ